MADLPLGCSDFSDKVTVNCCDSCHEDWEEYDMDMVWLFEDMDGVTAHVCCAVSRALDELKI